jgi:hypothetical protein
MKLALRICTLLLLLAASASAQEFSVIKEREANLASGIRVARLEASSDKGAVSGTVIEINSAGTGSRVEAVAASADPWVAHPMEELIFRESSLGGISFIGEPAREQIGGWSEFQFLRGTVWSWPSIGPVLTVGPDGHSRIIEIPPPNSASIRDTSGEWAIPLGSVNGPTREDKVTLVCGPLNGRSPLVSLWPEGTTVVALVPARSNTLKSATFWDSSVPDINRLWIPGPSSLIGTTSLSRDQWALLIPPSIPEADQQRIVDGVGLLIDIPIGSEVPFSLFATGGGSWFVRDGATVSVPDEPKEGIRSFLAVDSAGQRCWMVMLQSELRSGVTNAQAFEILHGRGAWNAMELPDTQNRMAMAPISITGWQPLPPAIPARTSLLAVNRPVDLATLGGERLRKLRILRTEGSPSTHTANPPRAVADGRIGFHPSGDHFWRAPFSRTSLDGTPSVGAWLEITLPSDSVVSLIDFYHAENAGFSQHFNLKSYRVLGRARAAGEWEELMVYNHDISRSRERLRLEPPRILTQLRLEITEPGFLPGLNSVRLAEVIVWGTPAQ